jgi:hypothetical protein
MCVRQVSRKTNIFMVYVKKEKNYLMKSIIISTDFYLFTHVAYKSIFMKRLCERVACEDGRANWGDIIAGGNRDDLEGEGGVMHPYLDEGIVGQRLSTHSCFFVGNPRILSSRSDDGGIVVTFLSW